MHPAPTAGAQPPALCRAHCNLCNVRLAHSAAASRSTKLLQQSDPTRETLQGALEVTCLTRPRPIRIQGPRRRIERKRRLQLACGGLTTGFQQRGPLRQPFVGALAIEAVSGRIRVAAFSMLRASIPPPLKTCGKPGTRPASLTAFFDPRQTRFEPLGLDCIY